MNSQTEVVLPLNFDMVTEARRPVLSICIATYNRGDYIGSTLETLINNSYKNIEIVIIDGASSDRTPEVVATFLARDSRVRYFRLDRNGGVDADYDVAVQRAQGTYCWLMTDDDLVEENAIDKILTALITKRPDLLVLNASVWNSDYSSKIAERQLAASRADFGPDEFIEFFEQCCAYLSFIGSVVVRRALWCARERAKYYGSLFIHVGVLFQSPVGYSIAIIQAPVIRIRYGNAMWRPRSFEIWNFKWPELIWSFEHFPVKSRSAITPRFPADRFRTIFYYRALNNFDFTHYYKFSNHYLSLIKLLQAKIVASIPVCLAYGASKWYFRISNRGSPLMVYDLNSANTKNKNR